MHVHERIDKLVELRAAIAEALKLPGAVRRYPQEEALIAQYVVAFKIDELIDVGNELINTQRDNT